ncbi:MAG: hypothetical protein AB8G05_00735 [Oligoflexales bacterium]
MVNPFKQHVDENEVDICYQTYANELGISVASVYNLFGFKPPDPDSPAKKTLYNKLLTLMGVTQTEKADLLDQLRVFRKLNAFISKHSHYPGISTKIFDKLYPDLRSDLADLEIGVLVKIEKRIIEASAYAIQVVLWNENNCSKLSIARNDLQTVQVFDVMSIQKMILETIDEKTICLFHSAPRRFKIPSLGIERFLKLIDEVICSIDIDEKNQLVFEVHSSSHNTKIVFKDILLNFGDLDTFKKYFDSDEKKDQTKTAEATLLRKPELEKSILHLNNLDKVELNRVNKILKYTVMHKELLPILEVAATQIEKIKNQK